MFPTVGLSALEAAEAASDTKPPNIQGTNDLTIHYKTSKSRGTTQLRGKMFVKRYTRPHSRPTLYYLEFLYLGTTKVILIKSGIYKKRLLIKGVLDMALKINIGT